MTTHPPGGHPHHATPHPTHQRPSQSFLSLNGGLRGCGWCGRELVGRVDRLFCSVGCRVAAWRDREGDDAETVTEAGRAVTEGRDDAADARFVGGVLDRLADEQESEERWP